jgi:histidine ammonia-lyase
MGTIAARDALRVLELSEQVAAANVIAVVQALRLRQRAGQLTDTAIGSRIGRFLANMGEIVPFIDDDVPLDGLLHRLVEAVGSRAFALEDDG